MTTHDAKCTKCNGEGRVADSDDQEPWSDWENLPPGSDLAVQMGLVKPIPCPECGGSMAEVRELWQVHWIKDGVRDLVAQREFEIEGDPVLVRNWIRTQCIRWLHLHPSGVGGNWEMVRQDSPKFFLQVLPKKAAEP